MGGAPRTGRRVRIRAAALLAVVPACGANLTIVEVPAPGVDAGDGGQGDSRVPDGADAATPARDASNDSEDAFDAAPRNSSCSLAGGICTCTASPCTVQCPPDAASCTVTCPAGDGRPCLIYCQSSQTVVCQSGDCVVHGCGCELAVPPFGTCD